jgi:energy-coupling factor transport system ATP-binding protein
MKRPEDRIRRAVEKALEQCSLSEEAKTHPHDLGLPDRKWITIASALASEAPVLVLDEPTLGQDWSARRRLTELIRSLVQDDRLALVVSHDMDFVAESCGTTVVLSHGAIRQQTATTEAFADESLIGEAGLDLPATARLGAALGLTPAPVSEEAFVGALQTRRPG